MASVGVRRGSARFAFGRYPARTRHCGAFPVPQAAHRADSAGGPRKDTITCGNLRRSSRVTAVCPARMSGRGAAFFLRTTGPEGAEATASRGRWPRGRTSAWRSGDRRSGEPAPPPTCMGIRRMAGNMPPARRLGMVPALQDGSPRIITQVDAILSIFAPRRYTTRWGEASLKAVREAVDPRIDRSTRIRARGRPPAGAGERDDARFGGRAVRQVRPEGGCPPGQKFSEISRWTEVQDATKSACSRVNSS